MQDRTPRNLFILVGSFILMIGCAGQRVHPTVAASNTPAACEVLLNEKDAWRAVMRFSDKNDYRLLNLDSDKGLMEISSGDLFTSGYSSDFFHYALSFVGLEKGTRIVIEGSFHNSDGKEVPLNDSLVKIKKENEYRLLAALKKYFDLELNNGSEKRALP